MKDNRITVTISKPLEDVFAFTTNPQNTHQWIESLVKEEANNWPVKVGTVYRNQNHQGEWSKYRVTKFEKNARFELVSDDGNYHVRYTYRLTPSNATELEYYEWIDEGELEDPFEEKTMKTLKRILENKEP